MSQGLQVARTLLLGKRSLSLSLTKRVRLLAAVMVAMPGMAAAQSAEDGKAVFNKCRACHQVGPTAKNMVGPALNGLMGRKAGTVEGFNYSEANKNSGITWDQATFREYIKNPKAKIPNTKMVFPGLNDEKDINDLLAFLEQYAADGQTK